MPEGVVEHELCGRGRAVLGRLRKTRWKQDEEAGSRGRRALAMHRWIYRSVIGPAERGECLGLASPTQRCCWHAARGRLEGGCLGTGWRRSAGRAGPWYAGNVFGGTPGEGVAPAEMEIAVSPKHASRGSKQQCYMAVSKCFKQEKKRNLTALWSQRAARLCSKTSTEVKATCTNASCTKWVTTMSLRVHHEECHVAMVGVKLMLSGNARVVITLRIASICEGRHVIGVRPLRSPEFVLWV